MSGAPPRGGSRPLLESPAWSLLAGVLFALGLSLSGMTHPSKVSGFLDVAAGWPRTTAGGGAAGWDPSLALVMGGALAVYGLVYRFLRRRAEVVAGALPPPAPASRINLRLIGGAALFGVGWGLSGFCPGPALVSLGAGATAALWFAPAMLAGVALASFIEDRGRRADGLGGSGSGAAPVADSAGEARDRAAGSGAAAPDGCG